MDFEIKKTFSATEEIHEDEIMLNILELANNVQQRANITPKNF
jgi:hypothetical protein